MRTFLLWTAALVMFDQATKALARGALAENQTWALIPRYVEFTLVYNKGIAFGLFQGLGVYLAPLAVIVVLVAAWTYVRSRAKDRLLRVGMILIAAGALGNFIDRIVSNGRVTDFIDLKVIHVFNAADAFISTAALILVVHWWREAQAGEGVLSSPDVSEKSETQAEDGTA